MALRTGLDIQEAARAGGYGVGAFNTSNLEITQAIVAAAEAERSPVLPAPSEGSLSCGKEELVSLVLDMAEQASEPVAVHLEHGSSAESFPRPPRLGPASLMLHRTGEDRETNIRETRR